MNEEGARAKEQLHPVDNSHEVESIPVSWPDPDVEVRGRLIRILDSVTCNHTSPHGSRSCVGCQAEALLAAGFTDVTLAKKTRAEAVEAPPKYGQDYSRVHSDEFLAQWDEYDTITEPHPEAPYLDEKFSEASTRRLAAATTDLAEALHQYFTAVSMMHAGSAETEQLGRLNYEVAKHVKEWNEAIWNHTHTSMLEFKPEYDA